jgi:hypothetical protein
MLVYMGRSLLVVVLTSVAALGQEQTQSGAPKLDPYRAKALENALRRPESSTAKQNGVLGNLTLRPFAATKLLAAAPSKPVAVCAIPLTRVPVDTEIDRGIQHKLPPGARHIDNMPISEGIPPCQQDHAPPH